MIKKSLTLFVVLQYCTLYVFAQAPVARKTTLHSTGAPGAEMQAVIKKFQSLRGKPPETLTPEIAREQPTIFQAVAAVLKDKNIVPPALALDTSGTEIPALGGPIHGRLYKPRQAGNWPIVIYYHGGGFVLGSIDDYDASARALAAQTGALVLSVEYRKGPEFRFPMAHRDCVAAYQWAIENGDTWGGNPRKIAVVGEGAGANLAAGVSLMAKQMGLQRPKTQVLIYPIAGNNMKTASYLKYARATPLSGATMPWLFKNYLSSAAEINDTRINLVKAELSDLPPTTIITAAIDPLHDEGQLLASIMQKSGVAVLYKNYDGVTHDFFGMGTLVPQAREAEALVAEQIKKAFTD